MSNSLTDRFTVIHPEPEHFAAIQDLCRKVYPFVKPWSLAQLEAHHSYFADGQLIVVEKSTGRVVGLAFSLIISWDDYSHQDNWRDFTSGGFFHNHNPRKGKTLYGAEIMVDPEYRGSGIGKMLYQGRQEIARRYGLKRIRAGARLRGYAKYKDQFTPEEYARQVVERKLFDPTLSFQLGQGFRVLDVAKNYLFNDPESLGFAAVIEWLNPEVATEKDVKKQNESVEMFLKNLKLPIEHLPRELRRLVRKITIALGEVIREQEGDDFYERVEYYRQHLKKSRTSKDGRLLASLYKKLESESADNRLKVAHGFSLLLELINVCESAYRTWRQRLKPTQYSLASKTELIFVLTAHPTEARSKTVVEILHSLIELLGDGLNNGFIFRDSEIYSQLRLLWQYPLVKTQAPNVLDEADYIYSLIFSEELFDFIVESKESYELKLRTWVGGDKDGHPGVTSEVMRRCLEGSRERLIAIIKNKLERVLQDLTKLRQIGQKRDSEIKAIIKLLRKAHGLRRISVHDGDKVLAWKAHYLSFVKSASTVVQKHHQIILISRIFELFPGMVLPLELRDGAPEISSALRSKSAAIRRMLSELRKIVGKVSVTNYVRGLVVSNCESAKSIREACDLVTLACGRKDLPVIPLFESREALKSARGILMEWLSDASHQKLVNESWGGKFEVMLGYSDSAKQIGAVSSRHLIRKSMFDIESTLKKYKVKPVFFHGSGGSVARGGGSLKEQIAWWPNSAILTPKLTVQGEMIQRTFATKEILNSQCQHLSNEARLRRARKVKLEPSAVLDRFVEGVEREYVGFVSNAELLSFALDATPYNYLSVLKIGSRPSKRPSGPASVKSLRAIPWVLCWTQTRLLLPTWWGVGTSWKSLSSEDRQILKSLFETDVFFSSLVKALGFTLAKVEIDVWEKYLVERHGSAAADKKRLFEAELKLALQFVHEVSGSKMLIQHKPWLEESIRLRSPYIHILNLLQILAMENNDEKLLKETVVGIACGMLTTG